MKFDHVGIAVEDITASSDFYKALGWTEMHVEEVPSEKVKVGMYECENDARVELIEPTSEDSPIKKFLDKRGPGIHHICLRVDNIHEKIKALKAAGVQLINEEPKAGAHNCLIAFVHPKSTGGVLVELSEKLKY